MTTLTLRAIPHAIQQHLPAHGLVVVLLRDPSDPCNDRGSQAVTICTTELAMQVAPRLGWPCDVTVEKATDPAGNSAGRIVSIRRAE